MQVINAVANTNYANVYISVRSNLSLICLLNVTQSVFVVYAISYNVGETLPATHLLFRSRSGKLATEIPASLANPLPAPHRWLKVIVVLIRSVTVLNYQIFAEEKLHFR